MYEPRKNMRIVSRSVYLCSKIYDDVFMWVKSREPLSIKFLKDPKKKIYPVDLN